MKKAIIGILVSLSMAVLWIVGMPKTVQASYYSVTSDQFDVKIHQGGSADVRNQVKYKMNGSVNQIKLKQDFPKGSNPDISSIQAYDSGNLLPLRNEFKTGNDNTYYTWIRDNQAEPVITHTFDPGKTDTIIYNYKVKNFVTNYNDTAEFNWRVFISDWDHKLSNVKINFQFPDKNFSYLNTWVHGAYNYHIKNDKTAGTAQVVLPRLSARQLVEIRMIFPTNVTIANKHQVNQNKKQSIIAHEESLRREYRNKLLAYWIIFAIFILIILWAFIRAIRDLNQRNHTPMASREWFGIPDVSPALAKIIYTKNEIADTESFAADLLIHMNQGDLNITPDGGIYAIEFIRPVDDKFYQYLLEKVGSDNRVTTQQIAKNNNSEMYYEFRAWKYRASKGRATYISKDPENRKSGLIKSALISSALMAIQFILTPFLLPSVLMPMIIIGGSIIIISWLLVFLLGKSEPAYTKAGREDFAELANFDKRLKEISKSDVAEMGDLIFWKNILPYAVAFDRYPQVFAQIKKYFVKSIIDDSKLKMYDEITPDDKEDFLTSLKNALNRN